MRYDNIVSKLISEVPEIKCEYEEELKCWDEGKPGPHIIFGDILNPFLIKLLENNKDHVTLKRIFLFLDNMAESLDKLVIEVLACTILERIGDDKEILNKAFQYMGEKCKVLSHEIEVGWGRK